MRGAALLLVVALLAGCSDSTPEPEGAFEAAVEAADTTQFDVGEPLARDPSPISPDPPPAPEATATPSVATPPRSGPAPTRNMPRTTPRQPPEARPEPPRVERPLAVATPVRAPADGRFALLVGISDYPGTRDDLPSGEHDVEAMRRVLVERYGYRPENVRTLLDRDATRGAIRAAIGTHLGQARTTALLYVSAHGVRLGFNPG
ncbi:MAG: caspase family protein, partial [Bacteroidota bacterium]